MGDRPPRRLDDAWLAAHAPPDVSPRVHRALESLVSRGAFGLDFEIAAPMRTAYRACEGELSRFPELADVGFAMLASDRSNDERRQACVWLTLFPSEAMVDALARVLLDGAEPAELRDQAAWSLGFRQVQQRHDALLWPAEAVARANDAIVDAWQRGLAPSLEQLAPASRHVHDPRLFAWMREHLAESWPAIEAFADAPLARVLLERLPEVPLDHVHRAIRLAAHVLGPDAAEALLAYAKDAPYSPRHEALLAAIALGSGEALERYDEAVAAMAFPAPARARREAWLASDGASLHVRALRAARTTATMDVPSRRRACVDACADFARLATVDAIHETYLHAMWRHAAWGARHDAASVVACVERSPKALDELPALAEPYVLALCGAGRYRDAARVGVDTGLAARASWELARHGRPFLALAAAASAREPSVWSAAGDALGAFLVGRVDLAQAAVDGYEPDAQARWDAGDTGSPVARAVLDRDVVGLASSCVPSPDGADPDAVDMAVIASAERRLRPRLDGACVFLTGFDAGAARQAARVRIEAAGARVVDAPFGNVDLCVVPDERPDAPVDARLVVRSVPIVTLTRALGGGRARAIQNEE
jgi:hypothetical protein